ncbi:MAG: CoA transferase subunit A [Candidatus Zophobacter franzmannii]|nr:CoA transferase subunit A [Candidatus Zophobacter franzmannii]
MPKIITAQEAANLVKQGDKILIGGFLAVGAPESIIDALVQKGTKDLKLVVIASDYEDKGMGKLVVNKQVKAVQVSHLGTNKEIQRQMYADEIKVELIPQGSLLERVRAAGSGLGGVLTPVGIGTLAAEGKQVINVDGKDFLLEKALHGDVALIHAHKADKQGNLIYRKTARNSNPVMATAGKIVIAEVDEIVEIGQLDPERVVTPSIFVNYLVKK